MRTPYETKHVPAAHPRRSNFAIHVERFLNRGIKFGSVGIWVLCFLRCAYERHQRGSIEWSSLNTLDVQAPRQSLEAGELSPKQLTINSFAA